MILGEEVTIKYGGFSFFGEVLFTQNDFVKIKLPYSQNGYNEGDIKMFNLKDDDSWLLIESNETLYNSVVRNNKDVIIKFDTGKVVNYLDNWPIAFATHFKKNE